MICDLCGSTKNIKVAVINGEFGLYCKTCLSLQSRTASAGHAQYSRDRDAEDHRADLVQPRDANGRPNPEFIRIYPEESKEIFKGEING